MLSALVLISPGGSDGREVLAHRLNDTSSPNPQSSADSYATVEQQPDGCGRILHHPTLRVDHPQGHQRTNGITTEQMNQIDYILYMEEIRIHMSLKYVL